MEIEGFSASRCDAHCASCRGRWYAETGSWDFVADSGTTGWRYDDAHGFNGKTIACQQCSGRIGFTIS